MKHTLFACAALAILMLLFLPSCTSINQQDGGPCSYEDFTDECYVTKIDSLEDGSRLIIFTGVSSYDIRTSESRGLLDSIETSAFSDTNNIFIITGSRITEGSCSPSSVHSVTLK